MDGTSEVPAFNAPEPGDVLPADEAQRPLTRLENGVSIFLAWWVVPLTLLAFWLRFLPRHDWLGTGLHVVLITIATGFGVHSYRLAVQTLSAGVTDYLQLHTLQLDFLRGVSMSRARSIRRNWSYARELTGVLVAIVLVLSVGAAIDPGDNPLTALGYKTYAYLDEADLSTKPADWAERDNTVEAEITQVKGADLRGKDLRYASAYRTFLVNARLENADLSRANLDSARLQGANLENAWLQEADLTYAELQGANLFRAQLQEADLYKAQLQYADLSGAELQGANLNYAELQGADLTEAQLQGADLRHTTLADANLRKADLTDAVLAGADLDKVRFCQTTMPDGTKNNTGCEAARTERPGN